MPLRSNPMDEPEINLTPMVDCVFLLIIFFMVGTQFAQVEQQHQINLPQTSAARPLTGGPDAITINVTQDGTILVGREVQTFEQMVATLQQAHERYADQVVVLRGDEEVQYGKVVAIFDVCARIGLKTSMATRPLQEGPS